MTSVVLGSHPENHESFTLTETDRFAGMYVLGVQGAGKSGLLENLIEQDAKAGNAVIVLDPHGDLTQHCLAALPPQRLPHTYILDMEDEAYPFGVNVFATGKLTTSIQHAQAVERIMHIFEVLWEDVLSQQHLPRYVRAATMTFLANPGATLVDMLDFLNDADVRHKMLQNVTDPTIKSFWQQFDNMRPDKQAQVLAPLTNRLESLFMGRSLIRNIVGQKRTTINFRRAIEQKQIVFIKLPIKQVAQDARLVGTVLLSQLYSAVFSFADIPEAERPGVSVYVDEAQHFSTPDFASLFTEGRKFGVKLTLAHQYRAQLPGFLRDSTMTARTKVCFQLTPDDGREMAHLFPAIGPAKIEQVEAHPVAYLLDHVWQDSQVRTFIDIYLRPLKRHAHGGTVEIEKPGVNWKQFAIHGLVGYKEAMKDKHTEADDPTQYLDALPREVMETGNPNLTIPLKAILGLTNSGKGFYKEALRAVKTPLLNGNPAYPARLVYSDRWIKTPSSSEEQFYHFLFHLRAVMKYLAHNPVGKRESITTAVIAQQLMHLPQRIAYAKTGERSGVIRTHDTPQKVRGNPFDERVQFVRKNTRDLYCHPRTQIEGTPIDALAEAIKVKTATEGTFPLRGQAASPVSRWEDEDV